MKTLLLTLGVAASSVHAARAEVIYLAHSQGPGNPRFEAANYFAEGLATCTGGRITVQVAPSATMGEDAELLISAAAGITHLTANSQGATAQFIPELNMIGLPFLFENAPEAWAVLDGPFGERLKAQAEETGLKILGFWDNGIRQITHLDKLITTPADLQGVKIRTPPDDMTIAIFKELGANPAPLSYSEVPTALQSGVFEAQENPLTNIQTSRIYEITPFISLVGHKFESAPLIASLSWFNALPPEDRACVESVAAESTVFQRRVATEQEARLQQQLTDEGATVVQVPDREAFRAATAHVYEEFESAMPEAYRMVMEAAE